MSGFTEEDLANMTDEEVNAIDFSIQRKDESEEETNEKTEEAETEKQDSSDKEEEESYSQQQQEEEPDEATEKEELNYEELYKQAVAPLKANGTELDLRDIAELRNLASMGANYTKKMQVIKPQLKAIRTLEKYDLLGEEQLNMMIALHNKDVGAITQLVKDAGIDPMDLDLEASGDFQAPSQVISDSEVAMQEVLESISDTDSYATTIDILSDQWDDLSRKELGQSPTIVAEINTQVASGVYDKVWKEVVRARSVGQLTDPNISDLQAYNIVGESMLENGLLDDGTSNKDAVAEAKEALRANQKQASSPTKSQKEKVKSNKPKYSVQDLMSMSDDEISALTI